MTCSHRAPCKLSCKHQLAAVAACGSRLLSLRCFLQAQALHPLSDVGVVKRLVAQLGQELARRMQQAHVLPGSRQVRSSTLVMEGCGIVSWSSSEPAAAECTCILKRVQAHVELQCI